MDAEKLIAAIMHRAKNGNVPAQTALGTAYRDLTDENPDNAEVALHWLGLAAHASPEAMCHLGHTLVCMKTNGEDIEDSDIVLWFARAACKKDIEAACVLQDLVDMGGEDKVMDAIYEAEVEQANGP